MVGDGAGSTRAYGIREPLPPAPIRLPPWTDKSSELKYLEDLKKQIEGRIEELKKSEK